jgi:hypothetical protein
MGLGRIGVRKISDDEILRAALEPNSWSVLLEQTDRRSLFDPETAESFAELHSVGKLDFLSLSGDAPSLEGHEFFLALHLICAVLPSIEADESVVKDVVLGLHAKASADLAAGSILDAFGRWVAKRPGQLALLLNQARGGDTGALELLPYLINASTEGALVLEMLQSTDSRAVIGALLALIWKDPSESIRADVATRVLSLSLHRGDDGIARRLLPAAVSVFTGSHEGRLSELLESYGAGSSLVDLHSASEALSRYVRRGSTMHIRQFVGTIEAMVVEHPAGLSAAMSALTNLATTNSLEIAGESIRRLSSNGVPEDLYQAFKANIASIVANRDHAPRVIADWLAYGDVTLLSSLSEVIGIEETPAAALKVDLSGIPPGRWSRAAYAATGWLFTQQFVAVNCLLWILKHSVNSEDRSLAKALLSDVFLKNYGGVYEMLSALERVDIEATGLREILLAEEERLKHLDRLDVPELQPSEQMNLIRRGIDERSFRDADDAVEPTGLMAIIPKTQILYGKTVISPVYQVDEDPVYEEIQMSSLSIQYENPRMLVLDPLKLDMIILNCRHRGLQ